jgi:NADH dehydrogenase (ubiquinone) 1 beta subcomplex subunit 9
MSLPYKPPVLSHVQQVQRLYKRALKLSLDWHIRRDLWRINALEIRQRFEANRYISEPKKIAHIIGLTEQELEDRSHPDPYLCKNCFFYYIMIYEILNFSSTYQLYFIKQLTNINIIRSYST